MAAYLDVCMSDVDFEICLRLDGRDLANMLATCSRLRTLNSSEMFWTVKMRRNYRISYASGNRAEFVRLHGMTRVGRINLALELHADSMVIDQWTSDLESRDQKYIVETAIANNRAKLVYWILAKKRISKECVPLQLFLPPKGIDNSESLLMALSALTLTGRVVEMDETFWYRLASFGRTMLRNVMSKYTIPDEYVSHAFRGALHRNCVNNFALLMSKFPMDDNSLCDALSSAAEVGSVGVLKYLLVTNRFDQEELSDIMLTSLTKDYYKSVAESDIVRIAKWASQDVVLRTIIESGQIDGNEIAHVVSVAVDRGRSALVDLMLPTISDEMIDAFYKYSFSEGDTTCLEYLVMRGSATRDSFDWTHLRLAIDCQSIPLIRHLASVTTFTDQDYCDALHNLRTTPALPIVQFLSNECFDVCRDDNKLVKIAADQCNAPLVDCLISCGATLDSDYNSFLLWACAHNLGDKVAHFVDNCRCEDYLDAAIVAINTNHIAILRLLLERVDNARLPRCELLSYASAIARADVTQCIRDSPGA